MILDFLQNDYYYYLSLSKRFSARALFFSFRNSLGNYFRNSFRNFSRNTCRKAPSNWEILKSPFHSLHLIVDFIGKSFSKSSNNFFRKFFGNSLSNSQYLHFFLAINPTNFPVFSPKIYFDIILENCHSI